MTIQEAVNPSFVAPILDLVPDAIIWVRPVFSHEGIVEDFEIGYSNRAANVGINHPKGALLGLRILRDGVPARESAFGNFQHFLDVYQTGAVKEYTFFAAHANRQFETVRRMYEGGVLSTTRDRRAQREAEQKEQTTRRTLQSIVDGSPIGIVVYASVRNATGEIVDFKLSQYNQRSNDLIGIAHKEREKLTLRQVLGKLGAEQIFSQYVGVVEKGIPVQREQYIEATHKWISISAVKLDDSILIMLTDITVQKLSQEKLQIQSDYLNSILNASLNAVFTCEAMRDQHGNIVDFRYTQVNHMFLQVVRKTEKEVIGKTMLELFPSTKSLGVFDTYCKVIAEGTSARFDLHYQEDGSDAWLDISSAKIGDNGVVVTFADITEQKKAAIQQEHQKNLLDNILRNSPSGVTVYHVLRNEQGQVHDFQCILANEAAEKFTQISNKERFQKTILEITPSLKDSPLFGLAVSAVETGQMFQYQYYHTPINKWLELSVAKMDDAHLINVFTDITNTKEAQLQLERSVEELKRLNANLEEFAYAASHDLKEPIRKINFFSDRLKDQMADRMSDEERAIMDRIENASMRMGTLVDDLLEYTYVSRGAAIQDDVDLNQVLQFVLEDLELTIQEKGGNVLVDTLPRVRGHKRQLQQLFQNLISNALKYSKPEVAPVITISVQQVKGRESGMAVSLSEQEQLYYLIRVKDNGIGFDQEDAGRIFNVFTRLHGKNEYSGTGVGLSIARKVVENHHGYIWAASEPDKGSSFFIMLPS